VKSLIIDAPLGQFQINATLLRKSLGDLQSSLVVVSLEDPELVLFGIEPVLAALAKRSSHVWAVVFADPERVEPNAATDPDLLAQIPWRDLLWL
jgi:hypothetical protein